MSLPPSRSARADLLTLGFATALAQATLLREAMSALGGSELAWGAVLGLWLLGMAGGATLGVRRGSSAMAAWTGGAVLLLAAAGVLLLRAAPTLTGASPGEAPTTVRLAWVWLLAVLPAAGVGGWAFPILAGALESRRGAGTAYALESAGAAAGGLAFTLLLAPWGTAAVLCTGTAAALAAVAVARRRRVTGAVVVVVGVALAWPASTWLAEASWRWSQRSGRLGAWAETRQQRLELGLGESTALYSDGRLVAVFPDPYRVAPRAHLLMLLHPNPRRVLLVAGLSSGLLPEILRHPVERVDVVEDDPEVPRVLARWLDSQLGAAMRDPRVVIHREGGSRILARGGLWDLVVLADPDPATLRQNRTRTLGAFEELASHLGPRGVIAMRVGTSDTYLGGAGGRLLASLATTARMVVPFVRALPGEEVLLLAARERDAIVIDPAVLRARLAELGLRGAPVPPEVIDMACDTRRASALNAFLATASGPVNRDDRPAALLPAVALQEARGVAPLLPAIEAVGAAARRWGVFAVGLLCAGLLLRGAVGRGLTSAVAAVTGAVSMTWWVLLLAVWQRARGSVFVEVGLLSACFMTGLVGGAFLARRWGSLETRALPWLCCGGAVLSAAMGAGLAGVWSVVMVPALLCLAGGLTGAAFPALSALTGVDDSRRGAGRSFSLEETGSAVAAAAIGMLLLPSVGAGAIAWSAAAVGVAAAVALALSRVRHSR